MAKTVGVIQSNYIPWKGYFDFIASVDEFVLFDQVQYTRRDWRNRNKIKTKDGLRWLTVPVDVKGKYLQSVDQTSIADGGWIDEHVLALRHAYARAPHFAQTWAWLEPAYESIRDTRSLSHANHALISACCEALGIDTPIRRGREFAEVQDRNERIVSICRELGATEYLSGPAARAYLDEALFSAHGIAVRYKSYEGYPEYPQLHGPFEHGVSVLDVFFHTGERARDYAILDRDGRAVPPPAGKIRLDS